MYRILIVEDEKWIRKAIVSKLSKCRTDIEVVGEVENGLEALEVLAREPVDIVMTDIRMPHMNGLDLITAVKERS